MIKCPRCGFRQPKDKYCAQCGVDMESFKPPTPPLMKRIFGNHFFQFGMLLVVTGIIGFFISQRSSDSSPWHAFTQKATVQIETAPLTPPPPPPPTTENEKAAPPTPTVTPTEQAEAASVAPAAKPAPKEETKETTKAVTKPHLIVYYAEVSRSALSSIFENSQNTGQFMSFKDYSAGILPGITKQLANSSVKVLHKEDRALDSSKTLQWFYGLKDRRNPSVEIGLTTFFELNDIDGTNLRGNIEIQRTWREPGASGGVEIQRKSFPAIFEIGSGTGFFLSGVMPTQSLLENEDELLSIDVYKILRSSQFKSGDSDFVIFVEFAKTN